jgi:catechol 2,3-dioxygenase-like lactoylglutathione lyase family enzyme
MLPVADLDRSVAFYTRLLGMKVKERHAVRRGRWKWFLMGLSAWIHDPDGHELELAERHPRT